MSWFSGPTGSTNLLEFYSNNAKPDHRGRTLNYILNWSDDELEHIHDYIQIIFPLPEASLATPHAPLITEEIYDAFNKNGGQPDLHKNLQRSFVRMMVFYGFFVDDNKLEPRAGQMTPTTELIPSSNSWERFENWIFGGHNNLRITRIIRSLRVLGRQDLAAMMIETFDGPFNLPGGGVRVPHSKGFWSKAFKWPLYSPPSGNEGEIGKGLEWLKRKVDAGGNEESQGNI